MWRFPTSQDPADRAAATQPWPGGSRRTTAMAPAAWAPAVGRAALIGLLCAALLCLAGPAVGPAIAAEDFKWSSSVESTNLVSGQDEKPLLVIDLAGDVTGTPFTSRMGRLLAATTFGDPRIIELSRSRFEVVCRQHGATDLVKRHAPKRERDDGDIQQSDNVVFYFCTPRGRVLHMAIGFLPADELLAAAGLAERLLRETQLQRDIAGQMQAVQGWHVTCADSKHLISFQRQCAGRRVERGLAGSWDPRHVRQVVATAAEVHTQELKLRFAGQWQGAMLEQVVARLGHHGEVASSFAHLVLSEIPLVPLETLDRICFETVTGQPFLTITARRKALYGWFAASRRQRRPILLVVDDQPFAAPPINELAELLIWQPSNSEVRERLASFAAVQVTPGELAALIKDASLEPVTLSRKSRNWLLYDRQGIYVDVVVTEHGSRLLDAMNSAAE